MGVLSTGRVLVIGNEPAIVNLLRSSLRAEGFGVTGASDGIEGEQRALADDVTLVVLDRIVSGRDGLDVLKLVRQQKPELRIIVLSARAAVADRIAAFDAGATDFLAKPFSPGELVARVRAQLRRAAWT
jgi:two-component system OmpR family response regulator